MIKSVFYLEINSKINEVKIRLKNDYEFETVFLFKMFVNNINSITFFRCFLQDTKKSFFRMIHICKFGFSEQIRQWSDCRRYLQL